jgi:hypothetical protein
MSRLLASPPYLGFGFLEFVIPVRYALRRFGRVVNFTFKQILKPRLGVGFAVVGPSA